MFCNFRHLVLGPLEISSAWILSTGYLVTQIDVLALYCACPARCSWVAVSGSTRRCPMSELTLRTRTSARSGPVVCLMGSPSFRGSKTCAKSCAWNLRRACVRVQVGWAGIEREGRGGLANGDQSDKAPLLLSLSLHSTVVGYPSAKARARALTCDCYNKAGRARSSIAAQGSSGGNYRSGGVDEW